MLTAVSTTGQTVLTLRAGRVKRLELPAPDDEVLPGITWGRFDEFFTPAFWVARVWIDGRQSNFAEYRLGHTLNEEVAACLLGGYGMPAEVGVAAFERLRTGGMLKAGVSAAEFESALAEPLLVGGRTIRYRYPRQKSRYLCLALERLAREQAPDDNRRFRDWLMTFDGIGPKTASWITRNHRHADDVAILDIHIQRAGRLAGLFSEQDRVERDYHEMERRLVAFAAALRLRLSVFDSLVWSYMKRLNHVALDSIKAA